MKLKFILKCILIFLLFSLLPVLVNQLMRIDWFEDVVVGNESTWISFYGSYIGGLLTLVGVIITIDYQNKSNKKTVEEVDNKNTKIIDKLVDNAFSYLLYFTMVDHHDYDIKERDISFMKMELIKLKLKTKELNELSLELIPKQFFEEFTHIKSLISILEIEINEIFKDNSLDYLEIQKRLKKVRITSRIKIILEQYIKFAEHKEMMKGVLLDLDNMNK
ncbi:hypothetical protein [Peribacillus frigoritolerans]|uniref:hypothetical protein n=1 Tax=Peribacillus frigoritolerans TaxID=450367 RepID=UPI001F4F8148|nr:hypothetical protein [Peribacillus frigoritolerans]MCK2020771.1 hypothetical protein [Peribacillus frigoritolerans]